MKKEINKGYVASSYLEIFNIFVFFVKSEHGIMAANYYLTFRSDMFCKDQTYIQSI